MTAFLEILAAFRGNKDLDKISKILKDFSKDLLIYLRLSVKTPPAQNVSLYETENIK
jgi:tryptophanase